jgi:hypothetical protein
MIQGGALTDRNRFGQLLGRPQVDDDCCSFAKAGHSAVTIVPFHLGVEARRTQLQAVAHLIDLVKDFLGGLIGDRPTANVAEDECAVSLHLEASREKNRTA